MVWDSLVDYKNVLANHLPQMKPSWVLIIRQTVQITITDCQSVYEYLKYLYDLCKLFKATATELCDGRQNSFSAFDPCKLLSRKEIVWKSGWCCEFAFLTIVFFSYCEFSQESLIATAGFESEVHYVETEDGYNLKIHRIKPKVLTTYQLAPVFFMHGLFATAADYLMVGADEGLRKIGCNSGCNLKFIFFLF